MRNRNFNLSEILDVPDLWIFHDPKIRPQIGGAQVGGCIVLIISYLPPHFHPHRSSQLNLLHLPRHIFSRPFYERFQHFRTRRLQFHAWLPLRKFYQLLWLYLEFNIQISANGFWRSVKIYCNDASDWKYTEKLLL